MIAVVKEIDDISNKGVKVTFSCVIEIKGQEKPACVAEFIAAFFE
jgi:acyl dehydratase